MDSLKSKISIGLDEIPETFDSLEAAADFWDSHDVTDYFNLTSEVNDVRIELNRKYFKTDKNLSKKNFRRS